MAKSSAKTKTKGRYSLHPGFAREAAYRRNLEERSGKSLEEWVALTKKRGPATKKERVDWLKGEHALTTDDAKWVAEACEGDTGAAAYDPDALVDAMFAKKASLLPIYEELLDLSLAIGPDAKACPCGTIVPIFRSW